jgi:hypothetical protein
MIWMQHKHIPEILATGKFVSARLVRVLIEEEMGGVFSAQYTTDSKDFGKILSRRCTNFRAEIELLEKVLAFERVTSDFGSLKSSIVT